MHVNRWGKPQNSEVMAEFRFHALTSDRRNLLEAVLAIPGTTVSPNMNYPTPTPLYFSSLDEKLINFMDTNPTLFITGSFSTYGLATTEVMGGEFRDTFVVEGRKGGPSLSLTLPRSQDAKGCTYVGQGALYIEREYCIDEETGWAVPNEDVKRAYSEMRRCLKKCLVNRKIGRSLWISPKAYSRVESGRGLVLGNGWWMDSKGHKRLSNRDFRTAVGL
jgi:hypothetical protein